MTSIDCESRGHLRGAEAPEWKRLEDVSATRLLNTPPEERFDRVTRLAQGLFGVSAAGISLMVENRQYLKSFVGPLSRGSERPDAFCVETIKTPETLIVEDALADERFRDSPFVTGGPRLRFYAGHPLTGPGGTHVGTFCIADQVPRQFRAEEQKILEDLTEIIQREMNLSWDIESGARVQRALQPAVPPAPEGYSLGTCFYPASGLSGDFYEFGTTAAEQLRVTVGDAMGKGVGPGLVAAAVHSAFSHNGWDAEPALLFEKAARDLDEKLARVGSYATVFHALIDPATGAGRYADAGQGLSHILRTDNTIERLSPTGPPLGLVSGQGWSTGTFQLGPGDAVLVPTDGVLDLHGGHLDQLRPLIRGRPGRDDLDGALRELCDRRGKRVVLDDITAVILRRDTSPA